MNLLFIHPTPALRHDKAYLQACDILSATGRINPVFVYNGFELEQGAHKVPTESFNEWVQSNEAEINATDILTLEARYPRSNLWQGIVSERRISNYSLLNGSYPTIRYTHDELIYFLKALVLFYEQILEKYKIEAILAHHTDNAHSSILFEMARSTSQVCFLLFPDYYWNQGWHYLFDSKYFMSTAIKRYYHQALAHYDEMVLPREREIQHYLDLRNANDPSNCATRVLPNLTLRKNLRNALEGGKKSHLKRFWRKPGIIDGFGHLHMPTSIKGFLMRNLNLLANRYFFRCAKELPSKPFAYFPLQRVPEAAMLSRAPVYLNQQGLIQAISASLPAGYMLVVKDHPRCNGIHSPRFYKGMSDLENVVVIESGFSNHEILDRCKLVITLAGTLGFQQLMKNKPVVMFGRKFYETLEGVIRIDDMNELPYRLKDILIGGHQPDPNAMQRSLFAFVAALLEYRYEVNADAVSLHHKPAELAQLIERMVEREVAMLVEEKSMTGKASV